MLTYSFIQHPIDRILSNLDNMFPGIQEGYVLYASYNKEIVVNQYENGELEKMDLKKELPLIQKFRKKKQPYNWLSSELLHFITGAKKSRKKIKQLSLIEASDDHYLCLKFLSPIDHLYDCIILKIENTSSFEMSKSGSEINAQSKNLIGKLLLQTFKSRIAEEYQNNETHRMVLNNIHIQQSNNHSLEEENKLLRKNYKKSVLYFINNVLKRMSDKFDISIVLSDKAEDYILDKDLGIDTLERTLIQAAHMAINLTLHYSDTVIISPENIIVNQASQTANTPNQANQSASPLAHNDKHANVIEILDNYEKAAQVAQAKDWKINGKTVAELCTPSVTPSAISFNLKKYKKSINILLDRYEDRWTLLRSYFKPLKNIVEAKQSELNKYKSA